jgi:Protein of unknown function (DUF1579)
MKSMIAAVAALTVLTAAVVAQAPQTAKPGADTKTAAAQAPPARKPGPEHKRIGYFAGQWNFQGEAKPSPMGPGGKVTANETCEWFAGGFHLVCRSKGTGPMGPGTGQSVMRYDAGRKAYTFHAVSSHGDTIFIRGSVDGKVWTYVDDVTIEGKPMKIRATVTEETPTSYSFKLEASFDNGPMVVMEEGKATKVKGTT